MDLCTGAGQPVILHHSRSSVVPDRSSVVPLPLVCSCAILDEVHEVHEVHEGLDVRVTCAALQPVPRVKWLSWKFWALRQAERGGGIRILCATTRRLYILAEYRKVFVRREVHVRRDTHRKAGSAPKG